MKFLKLLAGAALAGILTVLTQIGGIVLIITLVLSIFVSKEIRGTPARAGAKVFLFITIYLLSTFALVPPIAKSLGRVPLPVFEDSNLQPATIWTCLLNRHYVRPQLNDALHLVSARLSDRFPGTKINYLDAGFPFIDGFPLFPHLSHNDGKKVDLAFQYDDSQTGKITNDVPSLIGYGICEEPAAGEADTPADCAQKGYWQYAALSRLMPQHQKKYFTFNSSRTAVLVNTLTAIDVVEKIFIEPHLKSRMNLTSSKIRFHGCHAVRHDDHIHVQIK